MVRFPGPSFAMRNSGQPLRCASIRQVTFVSTKRSFVATKVQLAWKILQRSSMSPEVHSDTKITVQTSFPTKCTTEIFQRNFILTEMSETGYSWKVGGAFSVTEGLRNCGSLSMDIRNTQVTEHAMRNCSCKLVCGSSYTVHRQMRETRMASRSVHSS